MPSHELLDAPQDLLRCRASVTAFQLNPTNPSSTADFSSGGGEFPHQVVTPYKERRAQRRGV